MTKPQNPITADAEFFRYDPDGPDGPITLDDGRPLTNKLANELADRAARVGPPVDTTDPRYAGLIPGGKSLSKDGKHSPSVTVVLPREVRDRVRQSAREEGMSVSKWLRILIEEKVA